MGKKKKRDAGATATAAATAGSESGPAGASPEPDATSDASPTAAAPEISLPPISSSPLSLVDLPAADLGAFFELCFPDKRLIELCHELKLHTPGYRLEALPPDQVARVLADEYLEAKDARPLLETAVREALRDPVLEGRELSAPELGQLIDLVVAGDPLQHLARIAWRSPLSSGGAERQMARGASQEGGGASLRRSRAPLRGRGRSCACRCAPVRRRGARSRREAARGGRRARASRGADRGIGAAAAAGSASGSRTASQR